MIKLNKIFVCEFITGGGLCAEALPISLAREGALMRDALLRDLSTLAYQIYTTVDARLAPPAHCFCVTVQANDDIWQLWQTHIAEADAVFLIAPETDGLLHYLTQIADLQGKLILGSGLDSIVSTSDKMATYMALKLASITTISTFTADDWINHEAYNKVNGGETSEDNGEDNGEEMAWLAKPNDGAGCEATVYFNNAENLIDWLIQNKKHSSHIVQPFQVGTPASISCVMHQGRAQLLSCNKQLINVNNHIVRFNGVLVNGMREHWQALEKIANQVAKAIPGLAGYVGIDVIVKNDKIYVLEINPRLTTSYSGLREATGTNPAELIINTLTQPEFNWPKLQQNIVNIHV